MSPSLRWLRSLSWVTVFLTSLLLNMFVCIPMVYFKSSSGRTGYVVPCAILAVLIYGVVVFLFISRDLRLGLELLESQRGNNAGLTARSRLLLARRQELLGSRAALVDDLLPIRSGEADGHHSAAEGDLRHSRSLNASIFQPPEERTPQSPTSGAFDDPHEGQIEDVFASREMHFLFFGLSVVWRENYKMRGYLHEMQLRSSVAKLEAEGEVRPPDDNKSFVTALSDSARTPCLRTPGGPLNYD